jgi:CheY-like chemotaxis protein
MAKALDNPEAICVLIVEDDDDSREMLGEWVSALGHRELRAANAEEASKHVLQSRPVLALIDLGLPGVDGYQLARDLRRALGRSIRLVALTGYSDVQSRRSADAAGFDDFVVKPVVLEVLLGLLRRDVA